MSLVTIGRVVDVEDLGTGGFKDFNEISNNGGPVGLADGGAGMAKLKNGGVVTEVGGLMLFFLAEGDEFLIGSFGEGTSSRSACAIGDHDPGEPIGGVLEAGGDSGESEDFEIVGVGTDSEVGGGGEVSEWILATGGIEIGGGLGEFHRREAPVFWRKTQREAKR
jgi:hypothetical protein